MVNLNSVPVRILFVEDNDGDAYLFRDALNKAGLVPEFTRVSDGDSARTICSTADRLSEFDLMVLDLRLPVIDGLELLEAIRQVPGGLALPVVIFTSSAAPGDRQCADDWPNKLFLEKPADLDGFFALGPIIRQFLEETLPKRRPLSEGYLEKIQKVSA